MRNIALTSLRYFTILAACSNSDGAEKSVVPVPTGDVAIYTAISGLTRDLTRGAVNLNLKDSLAPITVTLNPAEQCQTMDGFGAVITGFTCCNLLLIEPTDRHAFLTETFSDKDDFGSSYTHIPISRLDFSLDKYTCCDTRGIENLALQSEEKGYVLPILREILAINPSIKIIAAPWICPKWMKVKSLTDRTSLDSWMNGQLNPDYYRDYAIYFVKWIQASKAEGIDIYAVTPQNEPLNRGNFVSLYMEWEEQRNFVKTALGPQMRAAGLSTKIHAFDHNYSYDNIESQRNYSGKVYEDVAALQCLAGVAYHNCDSNYEELLNIHQAHFEKELLLTETSIGAWNGGHDLSKRLMEDMEEVALGIISNWCKGVIVWNLMLDNDRGPNREGSYQIRYGTVDINNSDHKTIICNSHYYIIAHLPNAVEPGAVRIVTTGCTNNGITCSVSENTDRTYTLVLINNNEESKKITVSDGRRHFAYNAPGKSITSYRWTEPK